MVHTAVQIFSNHQSPITNHQSPIPITNRQSPIANHQSPITNHQSTVGSRRVPRTLRSVVRGAQAGHPSVRACGRFRVAGRAAGGVGGARERRRILLPAVAVVDRGPLYVLSARARFTCFWLLYLRALGRSFYAIVATCRQQRALCGSRHLLLLPTRGTSLKPLASGGAFAALLVGVTRVWRHPCGVTRVVSPVCSPAIGWHSHVRC
jgi:hypothetical protein